MSQTRHEWKVGLFVLLGICLLGGLLIMFSKGINFTSTYTLNLNTASAGILKQRSLVMMAGVPIGSIGGITLAPDGKHVTVHLKIKSMYEIHGDAKFAIEQSGFLGDQYVAIIPGDNVALKLKDGDVVNAEQPFDLQSVGRSAQGFIERIDDTVRRLNEMIDEIHSETLNHHTLSNLSASVDELHDFAADAHTMVIGLNNLLQTNSGPFNASVQNIETATATLTNILSRVDQGQGMAGKILRNDEVATNLADLVDNLNKFSGNLNRYGIWKMLWKPPQQATNSPLPAGKH